MSLKHKHFPVYFPHSISKIIVSYYFTTHFLVYFPSLPLSLSLYLCNIILSFSIQSLSNTLLLFSLSVLYSLYPSKTHILVHFLSLTFYCLFFAFSHTYNFLYVSIHVSSIIFSLYLSLSLSLSLSNTISCVSLPLSLSLICQRNSYLNSLSTHIFFILFLSTRMFLCPLSLSLSLSHSN